MSIRVLYIAHAFPPTFGGVESHVWDISHRLSRRGHAVCCLVGGDVCEQWFGRVRVERIKELEVENLLNARRGHLADQRNQSLSSSLRTIIREALHKFQPTVIHFHNAHHFAPELAEAAFLEADHLPFLNSVHDRVGEYLYPDVLALPWRHTFFASAYLAQSFPSPHSENSVAWLGIDLQLHSPHGTLDPRLNKLERPIFLHPARLLRWKGSEISLEAFATARGLLRKGSLVLCASGNVVDNHDEIADLRFQLESRARALGLAAHLHFIDFTRDEMAQAYRTSNVVWYPTIDEEPYGLVPIESMACGTPVVVSDSGGMRETVLDGLTGMTVPKGDAGKLAHATMEILTEPLLRKRLIENGLLHSASFDVNLYAKRLEEIYISLGANLDEVHGTARSAETIHLTEFNRLREEIDNRTEISSHLVIAQITALGVSVSVIDKFPEALLGLSAVGSLLWLCWLDQTEQIYKIATYIASQLAPRLRAYAGENVFGWESYLRVLDHGGRAATRLLYGDGYSPSHHQVPPTQNVGKYIGLLFGGTTPLVVIIYLLAFVGRSSVPLSHVPALEVIFLRLTGVALVVMLWLYTYRQYRQFVLTLSYFDGALKDLGHTGEPHSAQVD